MEENQLLAEKSTESTFTKLVHTYVPFWPLFLLFIFLSFTSAYFYLRSQVPIYVASAKVLLKDPQKGSGDTRVLDALNIFSEKKIVENEIIVLKSSSIMKEVVKSLNLYSTLYKKGLAYKQELYGALCPIQLISVNKDQVQSSDFIDFVIDWKKESLQMNGKTYHFTDTLIIKNQLFIPLFNHDYVAQKDEEQFTLQIRSVSSEAASIIGSLSAVPISYSSTVIDVKLESPVPEKAYDILNKLFEVYNQFGIQDKNQMAIKTLDFIEDRLATITYQLDSVEGNIELYKTKNDVISLSDQATNYLNTFKEFDRENSILDIQLQLLEDLRKYVITKQNKSGTVPSLFLLNDETLKTLLSQLYTAEFDLESAKKTSGDRSDIVLMSEKKIVTIKNDIKENIDNVKRNLLIQKQNIENQLTYNKSLYASIPNKERGLLGISREREIKNNIYSYLLQKKEETAMSSASTSADLRLLESGYSFTPIRPISKNVYWFAGLFAIFLFIGYVQIVEKLRNKIMFRKDIEKRTQIPVVAEILQSDTSEPIAIQEGKRSVIAEQFRTLRTNLGFVGLNEKDKVLLVTSSISGEGKSFVALNTAISISLTGKKVALMELDLRKPKLSPILNVNSSPGISNYLINKASLEDIIKPTSFDHLFLVSAGSIPPNPSEIIGKPVFEKLMTELKATFDYVIMDSAPVAPVTDAQLLSKYADVSVFMIRHNYTPNHMLTLLESHHKLGKFNNMCIVFNGIMPRGTSLFTYGFGGYGNGYGEGYGYGYGYGKSYSDYYMNERNHPGFKNMWHIKKWVIRLFKNK